MQVECVVSQLFIQDLEKEVEFPSRADCSLLQLLLCPQNFEALTSKYFSLFTTHLKFLW